MVWAQWHTTRCVWPLSHTLLCLHSFWSLHRLISIIASKQLTENSPLSLCVCVCVIKYHCVALSQHNWLLCFANRFDNLGTHPCWDRWVPISLWSAQHLSPHPSSSPAHTASTTQLMIHLPVFFVYSDYYESKNQTIKLNIFCPVCFYWGTSGTSVCIMNLSAIMFWRYCAKLQCSLISQKWHRLRAGQRKPFGGVQLY